MRTSCRKNKQEQIMSGDLSVEDLYSLSDEKFISIIKGSLISQLKNSSVKEVFFPNASAPIIPVPEDRNPVGIIYSICRIDATAIAVVCSAIARTSLYGFNQTIDMNKSDAFWGDWLKNESPDYTRQLYFTYFDKYCQNDSGSCFFADYLNNSPEKWAQQLADHVTTNEFINQTIAKLIASEPNWLVKLNLILYKLHRLDSGQKETVLTKWQSAYSNIQEIWQTYNYVGDAYLNATIFLQDVQAAVTVATDASTQSISTHGAWVYPYTQYGVAVENFLSGRPKDLGFYTGAHPNNYVSGGGGGCFTGDTVVRLFDNQHKPISSIIAGDWVITANKQFAMVSDEKVVTRFKYQIELYGFNQMRPFFTAGHCFWTDNGWKAINPNIALSENHQLAVGRLIIGDRVLKLKKSNHSETEWLMIKSFSQTILPPGSPVYGLHLVDGHHSYHANDFLVRMNYPVLTEAKLSHGFSLLTASERQWMYHQISPIMPLLKKSLGDHIHEPLERALKQSNNQKLHDKSECNSPKHFINKQYIVYVLNQDACVYSSNHSLAKSLHITHGQVYFDGMQIKNVVIDKETIQWSEQHDGRYSSAALYFGHLDLSLSGTIFHGRTSQDAVAHDVFLGVAPSIYQTKISTRKLTSLPDNFDMSPDEPCNEGASFLLGFVEPDPLKKSQVPTLQFMLKTAVCSEWADLSDMVLFSTNEKTNNLVVTFDPKNTNYSDILQTGVDQYGFCFPGAGRLEFSWDATSLSGYFCQYTTTASPTEVVLYQLWSGNLLPSLELDPKSNTVFSTAVTEPDLSVADLFTLCVPQDQLQTTSNNLLVENMKWHLGLKHPDRLQNFLGQIQPLLPADRVSEIQQADDFYESFSNAYLCNGVGTLASSPLSDDEKSRLTSFFKEGLAKNPSYSIQSKFLLKHSYVQNIPRIADYLSDDGQKWAKELFDVLTTQQNINRLVTQIISTNNFEVCNRYATLLNILDSKSQLDSEFMQILNLHSGRTVSDKYLYPIDRLKFFLPFFYDTFISEFSTANKGNIKTDDLAAPIADNLSKISREQFTNVLATILSHANINNKFELAKKIRDDIDSHYAELIIVKPLANLIVYCLSYHDTLVKMYQWNDINNELMTSIFSAELSIYAQLWSNCPVFLTAYDLDFNSCVKIINFFSKLDIIDQFRKIIVNTCVIVNIDKTLKSINYRSSDLASWIPDLIQIFLNEYEKNPDSAIFQNIEIRKIASTLDEAMKALNSSVELSNALLDLLNATYGSKISLTLNELVDHITATYPKLSSMAPKLATALKGLAWIAGLYFVINDFKNWPSLAANQRASLIIDTFSLFIKLMDAMPDIISWGAKAGEHVLDKIRWLSNKLFKPSSLYDLKTAEVEIVDIGALEGEGAYLYDLIDFSSAVIDDAALAEAFFADFSKMLRWLGPLASGALSGLNLYTFVEDIKSGAAVKDQAFDGIVAVSSLLETICLTAELLEFSAVFGPAAVVFALVGVIFSLVKLFDPGSPPESPVDVFMDDMRRDFLPKLPKPSPTTFERRIDSRGQTYAANQRIFKMGHELQPKEQSFTQNQDHQLILTRLHLIRSSIHFTLKNSPEQLPALLHHFSRDIAALHDELHSYSRSTSYAI